MTMAGHLLPLLLAWMGLVMVLRRCCGANRRLAAIAAAGGFAAGAVAVALLLATVRGDLPYGLVKSAVGGLFLFFWLQALFALYRVTGSSRPAPALPAAPPAARCSPWWSLPAGMLAGSVMVCRLLPQGGNKLLPLLLLLLAAALLTAVAARLESRLPESLEVTASSLLAATTSLLLFGAAFSLRLDLFAPLTMKVMKFIHDFVHQFFESLLIPDHPFFRPVVWEYIGYLFGSGVGFWGGVVVWFTPVLLTLVAIRLEPLPSVSHIRQGARRRKLLAAAIRQRRLRLLVPGLALVMLLAAVYQSRFPAVEYWDPPPLAVTADPAGRIVVPKKGEVDLEDGRLHKYLYRQGGIEARFLIIETPDGRLTVTLDACAICKPEGYGQAEGTVICYYCKTLIPLETVGKPGGCNPVPIPFTLRDDAVVIAARDLLGSWTQTVTTTVRGGGGK